MSSRRWRCSPAASAAGWRWPAWRCRAPTCCCWTSPPTTSTCPRRRCCRPSWQDFGGTILLVSHDRYLIDALATQVWEVVPGERSLRVFPGTYTEYKAFRLAEAERSAAAASGGVRPVEEKTRARPAGLSKMEQKKRQERIDALEAEITKLESDLRAITRELESPSSDIWRIQRLGMEYTRLHGMLEDRMEEWGKLAEGQPQP